MAVLARITAELQSTANGMEASQIQSSGGGSVSIGSSIKHSDTYAFRCLNTGSSGIARVATIFGSSNNKLYARCYFYFADMPGSTNNIMAIWDGTTVFGAIKITSAGVLQLFDSAGQIGSDSSALSLNTWYCIELYYYNNTGTGKLELNARIDTISFASTTTSTNTGTPDRLSCGMVSNNTSYDIYVDDMGINDDQGSYCNSWLGRGGTLLLLPNASGDNSDWTPNSGASSLYTYIDEGSPNDSSDYIRSRTTSEIVDVNLEACGLTSEVINALIVGHRVNASTGTTSSVYKLRIKAAASGTVAESADLTPASTTWRSYQPDDNNATSYPLVSYVKPGTSSPWTPTDVDASQIGARTTTGSGDRYIQISTMWLLVDYSPPPPATSVDVFITAGGDDNFEVSNGNANNLTATDLRLDTSDPYVALLFRNVNLQQGGTVADAVIKIKPNASPTPSINCRIYAEYVDNPSDLSTASNNISGRTRTTNYVTWNASLTAGVYNTSPDISVVIEEVIGRAGYAGEKFNIILVNQSGGSIYIKAYDSGAGNAAELIVNLDTGGGNAYTKDLSDTVSNSDSLVRALNRSLSDSVGKSETFTKVATLLRSYNETMTIVETMYKQGQKVLSDSKSNSDSITKTPGKTFNNTVGNSEALSKIATLFRSYNETVGFSEVIIKMPGKVFNNTQGSSDNASIIKTYLRSISDQVSNADTIAKFIAVVRLESVGHSEVVLKYLQRTLNETKTVLDSILSTKTQYRTYNETVGNSEILGKVKTQYKTLTDTVNKAETFLKSLNRSRSDSVTVDDSVVAAVSGALNFMNTLIATDSIIKQVNKVYLDTLSPNESLIKQINRVLLDSSDTEESFSVNVYKAIELLETIANTDNIAKYTIKSLNDVVLNVSQITISSVVMRTFNETVSNSEVFTKIKNAVKNFGDSISNSDSISKFINKSYNETVVVVDKGLKKFLNGIELLWEKVTRPIEGVWNKLTRPSEDDWTRESRPSEDDWTKNNRPSEGTWNKESRPTDDDWTKQNRP